MVTNNLNDFVKSKGKEKTPFDKVEEKKTTKMVRISEDVQIRAKVFSVENKIKLTDLIDKAVIEYLNKQENVNK